MTLSKCWDAFDQEASTAFSMEEATFHNIPTNFISSQQWVLLIFCYLSPEVTDRFEQTVVCVLRPQFLKKETNQERSGDPEVGTVNPRNKRWNTDVYRHNEDGCESNLAATLLLITQKIQADWESQPQIPERQPATWNQGLDGLQWLKVQDAYWMYKKLFSMRNCDHEAHKTWCVHTSSALNSAVLHSGYRVFV